MNEILTGIQAKCVVFLITAFCVIPLKRVHGDFYQELASPCRVNGQDVEVMSLLKGVTAAHSINIWFDRRLDPSIEVTLAPQSGSVEESLEAIATKIDAEVGFAESVVILAPQGSAINAASMIERIRSQIRSGEVEQEQLLREHNISWEQLSRPRDIGKGIASQWSVRIDTDRLPHDLWRAWQVDGVDGVAAVVLLGEGFGMLPAFTDDGAGITFVQNESKIRATIGYPQAKLDRRTLKSLREIDSELKVSSRDALTYLTATSSTHHYLRKRSRAKQVKREATIDPMVKRFTFKADNRCVAILQYIGLEAGIEIDSSAASQERLDARISLNVEDTLVTEIMTNICNKAKLSIRFTGGKAILNDR